MLPLLVFLLRATPVYSLTCHCVNSSWCGSNGYCANGCRHLWSGPGCQVGYFSFNKTARQSTTFSAMYDASAAVDGNIPNNYAVPIFCTHTAETNTAGASWWVVTLDKINNYAILNVTLYNRRIYNSNRLSNFVILYSNESEGDPDPNSTTWHEFARENGTVGDTRTYTTNSTAIAKRVAVYLKAFTENPQAILSLCEVIVIGYELNECQSGFTGPGCLLRACDQCISTGGTCTGEFGSCRYDVCPDQSLLPPDCWRSLSNISVLDVRSTATCNSVLLSAVLNDTQPNIAASWLQLQVTTSAGQKVLDSKQFSLRETNSVYYNFRNAAENTSYNFTWKLVYCDSTDSSCFSSTGSKDLTVLTGKREYVFSHNGSCVFVHASSTTAECEPSSISQITCEPEVVGGVTFISSGSSVCGLESYRGYICSIAATINATTVERQSSYIVTGPHSSSASPKEESTGTVSGVLSGGIGGSFAVIVITVAIITTALYRRHRNSQSLASAVALETKSHVHVRESSLYANTMSSPDSGKYDNPYESLHKDMPLQGTEDYASLSSLT